MFLSIVLVTAVIILLHWTLTRKFSYWKRKGFLNYPGYFPFGTSKELTLVKRYQGFIHQELYNKLSPNPFGGIYVWNEPILFIRDPEIIRLIMVKEFQHFRDRGRVELSPKQPLSQHLFNLDGDIWRSLRIKLTPTFTSGRLKHMFSLFINAASKFDKCAFGLDTTSVEYEEFRKISQVMFIPYIPIKRIIGLALYHYFPFMRRFLDLNGIHKKIEELVFPLILDSVKHREQNNVRRNDFLDLMIQLQKRGKLENILLLKSINVHISFIEITTNLLVAQCFVFIVAGYETSSSVLSFAFYELALNQDIQDKLRKEIDEVTKNNGGEVDYQILNEMHYLDQVISEVLRKYPTAPLLERKCSKDFIVQNNPELIIEKGTKVWIPVYSLHHDPKYFKNPDNFDPDRFSPENKLSIVPFSYLPFGEGPRHCIGMRFGLLQTKLGIYTVISKYKVIPTEETPKRLNFRPSTLLTRTDQLIQLIIQPRDDLKASTTVISNENPAAT
ncbi:hypothetical protein O3M35_007768 [Rhynocoris fuscipes]|uniref:Cytochrome P450 n=1 Tax=Rhynocoris fuscipes TaxID=488301 RepID=A0AAW1DG96_9HEMI